MIPQVSRLTRFKSFFTRTTSTSAKMTPRKFDFDYNYDPEGTSIVKPDPYADQDPSEAITTTHHGFTYAAKTFSRNATPTRSRSNTPERPPIPSSPSPEYLAISQEPSHKPTDIFAHRKLLILDLNGTLVFRSPHVKRNAYQRMPGQRALRSVHRRPYLLSFEQYLFHPRTRAWLDTMVWSSAQPHSVKDMTEQCFPNHGDDLLAIWARDTLGLKEEDYCMYLFQSLRNSAVLTGTKIAKHKRRRTSRSHGVISESIQQRRLFYSTIHR